MAEGDAKKQAALKKLQEMKLRMEKMKLELVKASKKAGDEAKKAEG